MKHGAFKSRGGILDALPDDERKALGNIEVLAASEEAIQLEVYLLRKLITRYIETKEPVTRELLAKGMSIHNDNITRMTSRLLQAKSAMMRAASDSGSADKEALKESADRTNRYLQALTRPRPATFDPERGWVDAFNRVVAPPTAEAAPKVLPPPPTPEEYDAILAAEAEDGAEEWPPPPPPGAEL